MDLHELVPIAVLVGLVVLAGLVGHAIRRHRQGRTERQRLLANLGFYPLEEVGGSFPERVLDLVRRSSSQRLEPGEVFVASRGGVTAYLFRPEERGPGADDGGSGEVLAVVDPNLDLPRCAVVLWPGGGGPLAGLVGAVVERALEWSGAGTQAGMTRVKVEVEPGLGWQVAAMATDPETARRVLQPRLLRVLAEGQEGWGVQLGSDAVVVQLLVTRRGTAGAAGLQALVNRAWTLHDLLAATD